MPHIIKHPRTGEPISPLGFRKDGRAIWPIMGASEDPPAGDPPADPPADPPPADPPADDPPADPDGSDALGDAGKKALDAMKAKWKAAETKAQEADARAAALEAKAAGTEAEHLKQVEAQRVKDEALAAANERILKADIRTVAKGKLSDPSDAFRYPELIDLSTFEADGDGEFDSAAIAQAIDSLITAKPYLAAQGGSKFQGSADGGARNGTTATIETQIADAQKAGDIETVIALKQSLAASKNT